MKAYENLTQCTQTFKEIGAYGSVRNSNEYKTILKEIEGYELYEKDREAWEQAVPKTEFFVECLNGNISYSICD